VKCASLLVLAVSLGGCAGERASAKLIVESATTVKPSTGCGKPAGALGERRLEVQGRPGLFIVSIPSTYDASRPYPLGFALHGRNRNHRNCQEGDCAGVQSVMGEQAVLVYLQSLREPLEREDSGWEWPTERDDNLRFFDAVLERVGAELCIDERRVFVSGGSSGGTFANWLGCRYGDRLLAVSAVSGGFLEGERCVGAPPALLIHGIDDPHVKIERGVLARDSYASLAGCNAESQPPLAQMHASIRQARDATPSVERAECVDYVGCAAKSPLRWCEHSYGGYDGSTHGWPPVGGQLIWDFVSRLQ
jgi:poly(3-hydroxybutyrate) depolymerase